MRERVEAFTAPEGQVIRFAVSDAGLAVTITYPDDEVGSIRFVLAVEETERVRQMLTSDREEAT